jgi:chaperonin GroES
MITTSQRDWKKMIGSPSQVEWAERIRTLVGEEFDRVACTLRSVGQRQGKSKRADTDVILKILAEKRAAVMGSEQAGYFIRGWQEITDQVHKLMNEDSRFQAIRGIRQYRNGAEAVTEEKQMNIRPLYDRIVVKRSEEQETSRNGIIIPDSAKEKPQEGTVIAVGHGKRLDDGTLVPLDVKAGDRILFGKYSGSETKVGGTEFMIIREDDVLAILDGAAQSIPASA